MKKGFIAAIIIIALVTFASCSHEKDDLTVPKETILPHIETKETTAQIPTESQYQENTTTISSVLESERALLTLSSWKEYEIFEEAIGEASGIVKYEEIREFGEFKALVFLSDATHLSDYSYYMYILLSDGVVVPLYIAPYKEKAVSTQGMLSSSNSTDFRKINTAESGDVFYNNMRYTYVKGKLLCISWVSNRLEYTLGGDSSLMNYPIEGTTVVSKLLDSRTAENALASIGMQLDTVVE